MNNEGIKTSKMKKLARIGLLAFGIILMGIGISEGGYTDVLNKAIRICYECIGIG